MSGARSPRGVQDVSASKEREVVDTVPAHVPIKVKVKNEQGLKDVGNKHWARDFEIEVKNTGDKPIYYLYMAVVLRDVTIGGYPYAFSIDHGRRKLGLPETPIEPDDVPILPGESVTLKIPEDQVKGYEEGQNWDVGSNPKRVEIWMQTVKFGDGSYFLGTKGTFMKARPKERSSNEPLPKAGSGGCKTDTGALKTDHSGRFLEAIYSASPARILRANFLLPVKHTASTSSPLRDDCGCHTVYVSATASATARRWMTRGGRR
ncbi:MAG: hypothetical protein QOJ70_1728 [Acidobacteriota bacterium]|nr:hypothetical protein [Acidobacteriota bacterium]